MTNNHQHHENLVELFKEEKLSYKDVDDYSLRLITDVFKDALWVISPSHRATVSVALKAYLKYLGATPEDVSKEADLWKETTKEYLINKI